MHSDYSKLGYSPDFWANFQTATNYSKRVTVKTRFREPGNSQTSETHRNGNKYSREFKTNGLAYAISLK
jgi:plasmid maintenance system antidote protein VapI